MAMFRNALLSILVLLTLGGALLEGLLDPVPARFIQVNGLLIIFCAFVFITWSLKLRFAGTRK